MDFERTYKVLDDFGRDFCDLMLQKIEELDGIASGDLYNSIDWKIEQTENGLTLYMLSTNYFKFWDGGTKPHFPPIDALERWVREKGIEGRPMRVVRTWTWQTKDGRIHKNGKEVTILPTVRQIAFLVGRKISLEGTEPRSAFEAAYDALIGFYEPKIIEAFTEDTLENEGILLSLNKTLRNFL